MWYLPEATIPVNPKPNDPALLTLSQYFQLRNKEDKHHDDAVYKTTLHDLNYKFVIPTYQRDRSQLVMDGSRTQFVKVADSNSHNIKAAMVVPDEYSSDTTLVATYTDGKWFYNPKKIDNDVLKKLEPKGQYIVHKYPERILEMAIKEEASRQNKEEYGKPIKRIKVKGEYFTIHQNHDYGGAMVVMNSDNLIVANASNEWGATLVQVVQEYAGKGLGPLLSSMFIDEYQLPSGGYTPDGVKNATKIWNNRVREYIQNGWYTELIKKDKMTKEQVKKILSQYKANTKRTQEKVPDVTKNDSTTKPDYLCYSDGVAFILYDKKFLDEPDEEYIHGYTFLRSTDFESDFVYRFDYDDEHSRKMLSYILLQHQRNHDTGINIEFVGGDLFEYDGLKNIEVKDGMVYLTKDVIDIKKIFRLEEQIRKKTDPYNENLYLLHELAESKYD